MEVVVGTLRWGIVGTGSIAAQFAHDLAFVDHAALVAVASRRLAGAERFAATHGVPEAVGSYEALVAHRGVDAVYVATPHSLHRAHAEAALSGGKAVLCEKPLTPTLADAEAVVATARLAQVPLMEGLWTYFLPAIQTARRWVDEGLVGTIRHIQADFGFAAAYDPASRLYDPALAGGALLDIGIYPLALAWHLMGREPDHVFARMRRAPTGVDDDVVMVLDYGNDDCTASLVASFRGALRNEAAIVGSQGTIVIPDFFRATRCVRLEGGREVERFHDGRASIGLAYEIDAFSRDVLAGRVESDVVPWSTSLALQRHLQAVRDAAVRSPPAR